MTTSEHSHLESLPSEITNYIKNIHSVSCESCRRKIVNDLTIITISLCPRLSFTASSVFQSRMWSRTFIVSKYTNRPCDDLVRQFYAELDSEIRYIIFKDLHKKEQTYLDYLWLNVATDMSRLGLDPNLDTPPTDLDSQMKFNKVQQKIDSLYKDFVNTITLESLSKSGHISISICSSNEFTYKGQDVL